MKREDLTIPLDNLPLLGEWNCRLDITNQGIADAWFNEELNGLVYLPGTTDSNHLGIPNEEGSRWHLSRLFEFAGPAWYQKTFQLPQAWRERRVYLYLERVNWESQVWVGPDGGEARYAGRQNSLATPHIYDLTGLLETGPNRMTIRVNNAKYGYPRSGEVEADMLLGTGGSYNDASTSTNWNGILGRIELRAHDPIWIDTANVTPDVEAHKAHLQLEIGNSNGSSAEVDLQIQVRGKGEAVLARNAAGQALVFQARLKLAAGRVTRLGYDFEIGEGLRLWDEHDPYLYKVDISLSCLASQQIFTDSTSVVFGMRELSRVGTQIAVNGRVLFLRGTVDNAQFPLSGHAPMNQEPWLKIFETARSYGLNLFRFHSWCPPEAAFAAADETGFWLQVELPATSCLSRDEPPSLAQFLQSELARILATYGNHPSFLGLSMGNEQLVDGDVPFLVRHQAALAARVRFAQETDPRHLYTSTTHPYTPDRPDDYYVTAWGRTRAQRMVGIEWGGGDVLSQTRFNCAPPETESDYRQGLEGIDRPLLTHEVGQWAVFPNLAEIPKYKGLLRARNLEGIRQSLEEKGLLDQADHFVQASGRLSQILYREEIESALRTPGLAGFQLLGLLDQQGQGTSTVGLLDVFWESKGLTTAPEFSRYCADSVILLRMPRRVYTSQETFQARVEIAHYGAGILANVHPSWSIFDSDGSVLSFGDLPAGTIQPGGLSALGEISFALEAVPAPVRLSVSVYLAGTEIRNEWEFWVYPARLGDPPGSVLVAQEWNHEVKQALDAGQNVLLLPALESLPRSIPGCFTPVFWNVLMKHEQAAKTMGFLCEPAHPAFAHFPTEFHSNWQWWDLALRSRTLVLDAMPASFRPIVQVVDSCEKNRKLGAIFQARVGKGRLVVSSIDLANDLERRPVARQLRYSLLSYMNGERFRPPHELSLELLDGLLCKPQAL